MASSPKTYNPRVFYVDDPDQQDQCQFVYLPHNGEKPKRCQHDGIYRIGLTIFLCGIHMPGVGRHPISNPIDVKKIETPLSSKPRPGIEKTLLDCFLSNQGVVLTYDEIQAQFPNLNTRQYIFIAISKIRHNSGATILNVPHVGYKYLGSVE